jgi:hypothetical protein
MSDLFTIEALKPFKDIAAGVDRKVGERWEVDLERFNEVNSTIYGELAKRADEEPKQKAKGRPTKAELVAEAEALGVEVPKGATNPQIAKLIEEAR